jgi:hypothetical protein
MIDGTPVNPSTPSEADLLRIDLENATNRSNNLSDTLFRERATVRSLFEQLNEHIKEYQLSINDDISLSELDDMLLRAFTHRMTFTREYEVQVEHTIHTTFTITASSEDEAVEIANGIGICDEPEFDTPHDSEVSEWVLADTRILYSGEK